MNPKEFAEMLNGRELGSEITPHEEETAKEAGLVVVFGESDDLMEFRGALHAEYGAYEGVTVYLTANGSWNIQIVTTTIGCAAHTSSRR